MNKLMFFLGFVIAMTLPVLGGFFEEEVVVGEKLCVDGHWNKNLEGIMCEDTRSYVFGIGTLWYLLLVVLFAILGFVIMELPLPREARK